MITEIRTMTVLEAALRPQRLSTSELMSAPIEYTDHGLSIEPSLGFWGMWNMVKLHTEHGGFVDVFVLCDGG